LKTSVSIDHLDPRIIAWVERSLGMGFKVVRIYRSNATTSSTIYYLHALRGQTGIDCVLRLFTNLEWLQDEPDLAEHEASALAAAVRAGLPAPALLAYDASGHAGGIPAVLMSLLAGQVELKPLDFDSWLGQLAESLVLIHTVGPRDLAWEYFSWVDLDQLKPPGWSQRPQLWERAIEIWHSQSPVYRPVFLHRDYHPTNVLWQSGSLTGVVDWVNACQGPAGIDVAHCSHNLVYMYGPQAAERFLDLYTLSAGPEFNYQVYWELDTLLDGLPGGEYYPPWRVYGLDPFPRQVLRRRIEAWLEMVLGWA